MRRPYGLFKRGKFWWCRIAGRRLSTTCRGYEAAHDVAKQLERAAANPTGFAAKTATLGTALALLLSDRKEQVEAGRKSQTRQLGLVGLDFERELAEAEAAHGAAVLMVSDAVRALADAAVDWSASVRLGRQSLTRPKLEETTYSRVLETVTGVVGALEESVHQKAAELAAARTVEALTRSRRSGLRARLAELKRPPPRVTGTCEAVVQALACKSPAAVRLGGILFCAAHNPEAGDTQCPACGRMYFAAPTQKSTLCDTCR